MDFRNEFERIMAKGQDVALATINGNKPNVRVVFFYYNPEEKVVYIPTFAMSEKVVEIEANNHVAFTTIPIGMDAVRVKEATIKKSAKTVIDIKDDFIRKFPAFENIATHAGSNMIIYEVRFAEAYVIIGFNNTEKISI
jgi:uncharacterized pyridoxamine 5'-phosphate oxidase family protein